MVTTKAKRTDNWPWKAEGNSQPVRADAITLSKEFQIRVKGTVPGTVKKYADEMRLGQKFPPIELAEIKGKLYLINGFHRHEAAFIMLGHECLEAVVTQMTKTEAKAAASRANVTQGEGLKTADKRNRLRLYIQGRLNRKPDGSLQSYRELEKILGVPKSSIERYMKEDHPSTARLMSKDDPANHSGEPPQINTDPINLRRAHQALRGALEYADNLLDPRARWEVICAAEACIAKMKEADYTDMTNPDHW